MVCRFPALLLVSAAAVLLVPALRAAAAPAAPAREIATGPFRPSWVSLAQYSAPDWFRDAKLGIWARWSPQSVPEQGDDYARSLYIVTDPRTRRTNPVYSWHVDHYGHATKFGFKDLIPLWKAEAWDPEKLVTLFARAGARYFVALANDRDNFDCYDSKFQPWNSVALGPKKDLVAGWAVAARAAGLRFGVSVHAAAAWSWFEPAQGADVIGPFSGVRYDGRLDPNDSYGQWWRGLDPSGDLYAQRHRPGAPPDAAYTTKFFLRTKDLLDRHTPDLVLFGDDDLPLGEAGLNLAAHLYNSSQAAHAGRVDAVLAAPVTRPDRRAALVATFERAAPADESAANNAPAVAPWLTVTSIGSWHFKAGQPYRPAAEIVRQLVDTVSKNGGLLLNVPLRGDGALAADAAVVLDALAAWTTVHGEGIYGTRPWKIFGEGPSLATPARDGLLAESRLGLGAQDIRFTLTKDGRALHAFFFGRPADGKLLIKSLAAPALPGQKITAIALLGSAEKIVWSQDAAGLRVTLPAALPNDFACALKLTLE
jgi:alpha-L-fucosidase